MRQYVIDELREEEIARIRAFLDTACERSGLENLYWLNIPDDLLSPEQFAHKDCRPFAVGIEMGRREITFELLVRSMARIRCTCIAFATPAQRDFVLAFADRVVSKSAIPV